MKNYIVYTSIYSREMDSGNSLEMYTCENFKSLIEELDESDYIDGFEDMYEEELIDEFKQINGDGMNYYLISEIINNKLIPIIGETN